MNPSADNPLARGRRQLREEHTRYTLDLARTQHAFLKHFAVDAGAEASVVVRALLLLLEENEDLRRQVSDKIAAARGWQ